MNVLAIGVLTFIWELIALAIIVAITVVIALKKRIKPAIAFCVIAVVLLALETFARYLVLLALNDTSKAISIGLSWIPTVAFVFSVFCSTLLGVWRGFRKSALLMLHAVISAGVCIGLFFFCVNSKAVDGAVFSMVDKMAGGGICAQLGIADCSTMRELFIEFLPTLFPYGSELNIVLSENGAYLLTLADMAYRIVFGLVLYIIYLLLIFILYIVYHCAYSERKYKRRKKAMVEKNLTDRTYCAHRISGGVVGLVRGVTAGLVSLAFLGTALFMVADIGQKRSPDVNFSDSGANFAYSAFQSLENYGSEGIFSILNAVRDSDGQPYYLFAADLIFSGKLDDEQNDIHANIKFREEVGAYSKFARDTWNLMLRYGGDELSEALNGNGDVKTVVLKVFENSNFQTEFEAVIEDFDTQTYFINFALSAATSIISNIDETSLGSSMSESTRELMKIVFKPGHLSEKIPDEREMLNPVESGSQPYIGLPQLYSKEDTKIYYKMVVSFLKAKNEETGTLDIVRSLIPQMRQLSILSGKRADKLDPVFGRIYCYLANEHLSGESKQGVLYKDVAAANVEWTKEINTLLDTLDDGLKVYAACTEDGDFSLDNVLSLFDEQSDHYKHSALTYAETMSLYDGVVENLSSSKLLEQVLSTGFVYEKLTEVFTAVSKDIYIPRDIKYADSDEELGELHKLMYGLKLLGNKDNRESINKLTAGGNIEIADIFTLIANATQVKDDKDKSLSDYMTDSVFLRSLVSSVMLDNGEIIYVPSVTLESGSDNKPVRLIKKEVLNQLFESLSDKNVSEPLLAFMDDMQNFSVIINSEAICNTLCSGNGIIEGTVAKQLVSLFSSEGYSSIIIPNYLKLRDGQLPDGWLTQNGVAGELNKIVSALRLKGLDADAVMQNGTIDRAVLKDILEQNDNAAHLLMNSDVLRYTMSNAVINDQFMLGDGLDVIVPKSVLEEGDGETVIKAKEMEALCELLVKIEISKDGSARDIVNQLIKNIESVRESATVCASTANFLITNDKLGSIEIPQKYKDAGQRSALENEAQSVQLWQQEICDFANAAEMLFGDSEEIEISGELISGLTEERLHDIYTSRLVAATITARIRSKDIPLSDHPYAYESDPDERYSSLREIYRESEIRSLLQILNGSDIENFNLADIRKFKNFIYEDGVTSSYLLVATLSDNILENESFIVPKGVIDSNDIIFAEELYRLVDAFGVYNEDAQIGADDWSPEWSIPKKENIAVILRSAIIRATLTKTIGEQNQNQGNDQTLYVKSDNIKIEDRFKKYSSNGITTTIPSGAVSISEEQLTCILSLLSELSGEGDSFLLPQIKNFDDVAELADGSSLEKYLACDTLRYKISEVIINHTNRLVLYGSVFPSVGECCANIIERYAGHSENRFAVIKDNKTFESYHCFTVEDAVKSISELQQLKSEFDLPV